MSERPHTSITTTVFVFYRSGWYGLVKYGDENSVDDWREGNLLHLICRPDLLFVAPHEKKMTFLVQVYLFAHQCPIVFLHPIYQYIQTVEVVYKGLMAVHWE